MKVKALILCVLILSGCARYRERICRTCPTNTISETYDSIVPKTKFIQLPPDNSKAVLNFYCEDGSVPKMKVLENEGSKRMAPHQFDLDSKGNLTILTFADSQSIALDYFERYFFNRTTIERKVEVPVDNRTKAEKFFDSFAGFIFSILFCVIVAMLIYWALFKRKSS